MLDLEKWVRPNILTLKPYSSARDEFKGEASKYWDAPIFIPTLCNGD